MEKLIKHANGQWVLEKGAAPKLESPGIQEPSIHGLIGKTHTVEVHPHMDHLYNIKGAIKESGKPHMSIGDIKKRGFSSKVVDSLPRDPKGKVTPEMIDAHIASLPKQKVHVKVVPYEMKSQQHRDDVPQYTVSVGLHPESRLKNAKMANSWDFIKHSQHKISDNEDQIGWARIDPFKIDNGTITPNDKHWHIDEIQSDFHQPKKINEAKDGWSSYADTLRAQAEKHPDVKAANDKVNKLQQEYSNSTGTADEKNAMEKWVLARLDLGNTVEKITKKIIKEKHPYIDEEGMADQMHAFLSHGHEDPNHLVHSAVNELARKNGIESMSMDTHQDQIEQSRLSEGLDGPVPDWVEDTAHAAMAEAHADDLNEWFIQNYTDGDFKEDVDTTKNHHLKSALDKIGYKNTTKFLEYSASGADLLDYAHDHLNPTYNDEEHIKSLSEPERDALIEYVIDKKNNKKMPSLSDDVYDNVRQNHIYSHIDTDDQEEASIPVYHINTYNKRPKALRMAPESKSKVLGNHPKEDEDARVQYMKLHKKLLALNTLIKALKH